VATRRRRTAQQRHGKPILVGDGLSDSRGAFRDVSVSLRGGEVLALVGLPDSGAVELVQALAGARRLQSGRLSVDGEPVVARTPRDALQKKIGYLPGDRKRNGVIPNSTLAETLTLSALDQVSRWGWVSRSRQRDLADELVTSCEVRAATRQLPITALSGGNQQKALFARTMATRPRVIVCEDPTAGVDPGGRESLYELLAQACAGGAGVVIYSSDLREVCTLSDRAIVLWRGSCITELGRKDLSIPSLMSAQFNQPPNSGAISG
jgi:ABC-type sugar transport system ATPase subunit